MPTARARDGIPVIAWAHGTTGELFASYVIDAYSSAYPDVTYREYVRPGAQPVVREMAARCLAERSTLLSVLTIESLDKTIWNGDPNRGALATRLRENIPQTASKPPLFIGRGGADGLVVPAAQDAYVKSRCAAGQQVDYRTYAGRDHVPLVETRLPGRARPHRLDQGPPRREVATQHLRVGQLLNPSLHSPPDAAPAQFRSCAPERDRRGIRTDMSGKASAPSRLQ